MQTKQRVLIVGLGLIGASLATILKKQDSTIEVVALDQKQTSLQAGKAAGFIHEIGISLEQEAPLADIIILATPVSETLNYIQQLQHCSLKQDVLITDVGSTKESIMQEAQKFTEKGLCFIGGHPMAGSHKSGVWAADPYLFENAYYLLVPFKGQEAQLERLKQLLKPTGAKFLVLTAKQHDQIIGALSHVPHVIAAALVNQTTEFLANDQKAISLAAGGFLDITRIASADPMMWKDILLTNRENIQALLVPWIQTLQEISTWLEIADESSLFEFFKAAKIARDSLPKTTSGALPHLADLFVKVPDYPGVIAEVTACLAKAQVSLVNLRILETREEIPGILQLTFKNAHDLNKAKQALESTTAYECYKR